MSEPAATDIREAQVIKHGLAFLLTDRFGDVPKGNRAALGLYFRDTRFLSRLELTIDGLHPLLLHSSADRNYLQIVGLGYPVRMVDTSGHEQRENISLTRTRVLADSMTERIAVSNYGKEARRVRLRIDFDADFMDIFEVRGFRRERPGHPQPPQVGHNSVLFACLGADEVLRTTTLHFAPFPTELAETRAVYELDLAPGERSLIDVSITPQVGEAAPVRRGFQRDLELLRRQYAKWRQRCTTFESSNYVFSRFLERAVLDLRMLLSEDQRGRRFIDAGVPWFCALFGRDSLITAYEFLPVRPDLAWGVLRGLAALQGERVDEWREEEPGKILHEVRVGELAGAGEIPHTPYYGSIDATPLWLLLLAETYAWTGDLNVVRLLWPNALAALRWIDEYGDLDGDGYVEYRKLSPGGLDNQGWKDSYDAVVFPDGTLAQPPIALVEVQGYVYAAKRRIAGVARDLGDDGLAARLEREAEELKQRFNRDFWIERKGYFALALDGRKRPVPTVTSNPGHCLWSGIVDEEKAGAVAARLLSPALSTGWGVRTLAARQLAFDPLGYHTGTVWPHDSALIATGLKAYGLDEEAMAVSDQVAAAGPHFPLERYPELFCGFSREEVPVPVQYPVACRPQAWSSGVPMLLLRTFAGLVPDAPAGRLHIVRPQLPAWVESVDIRGMRVGRGRVSLTISSREGVTGLHVAKEGDMDVVIHQ